MAISTINQNGLNAPLTLTAPNLGTPSAINLTNATALGYAALPTGSVLQVVQGTSTTQQTTTSTNNVDCGLSASITPRYATSKILVLAMNNVGSTNSNGGNTVSYFDILRGSTVLTHTRFQIGNALATGTNAVHVGPINVQYLDSPATTSSTTYKMQMASNEVSITTTSAINGNVATIILIEIAG